MVESRWALAGATHRARDGEVAFWGDFGPAGQASFSISASHVKVKHCPFFVPKVFRAAAEEEHLSRSSIPNGSDYMESVDDDHGDAVRTTLDYVLDQMAATCANDSDRDIAMLSSATETGSGRYARKSFSVPCRRLASPNIGILPCHNAPIDGAALEQHNMPLSLEQPMVQFVVGPPRFLSHYASPSSGAKEIWAKNEAQAQEGKKGAKASGTTSAAATATVPVTTTAATEATGCAAATTAATFDPVNNVTASTADDVDVTATVAATDASATAAATSNTYPTLTANEIAPASHRSWVFTHCPLEPRCACCATDHVRCALRMEDSTVCHHGSVRANRREKDEDIHKGPVAGTYLIRSSYAGDSR
ncbi:hypothetical protein V8D89_002052 [Ganoderma adspersum]